MDLEGIIQVSIGQFYGIEINDFAVTVAKTALWIAESQMMKETVDIVHRELDFLPLRSYTNITEGNALRLDWESVVPKHDGSLMVIITFIYVVATILICWANLCAAKATRDQLKESKRQYEDEHRAFISYEFIYEKHVWYGLRFTNHGKRVATNVQLQLDKVFIDSLIEHNAREQLRRLDGKEFTLGIEQSYDIIFGGDEFRERPNKIPIQGTFSYKDRSGAYTDSFYIDFGKYAPIFTVTTDGERIEAAAKNLNKSLSAIGNDLGQINKTLQHQRKDNISNAK